MKLVKWNTFNKISKDPSNMLKRIIGLDIGTKHIGISVTDEDKIMAFPLSVIKRDQMNRMSVNAIQSLSSQLNKVINNERIFGIVIGLPVTDDGSITPLGREIMKLAESINLNGSNINTTTTNNNNNTIYYTYWSERGTTVMARAMLKHTTTSRNKLLSQKDTVAASLILQSYLNYHKLELHDL